MRLLFHLFIRLFQKALHILLFVIIHTNIEHIKHIFIILGSIKQVI